MYRSFVLIRYNYGLLQFSPSTLYQLLYIYFSESTMSYLNYESARINFCITNSNFVSLLLLSRWTRTIIGSEEDDKLTKRRRISELFSATTNTEKFFSSSVLFQQKKRWSNEYNFENQYYSGMIPYQNYKSGKSRKKVRNMSVK